MDSGKTTKRPHINSGQISTISPRPKRSKTSKACNACRKQKSRCERLAGDAEGCHRCGVIGIPCVFDSDGFATDNVKTRRPRPILPRSRPVDERRVSRISQDNSGLHVLANTTEMLSREGRPCVTSVASSSAPTSSSRGAPNTRIPPAPKAPLSAETLSTVESALFPAPRDGTSESELARFRADWRRWVAPLTLLQTLVRRNRVSSSSLQGSLPPDTKILTTAEEKRLKNHFQVRYSPWLPAVKLGQNGTLDEVSPFLATVIYATAARTLGTISQSTMEHLHAHSLHHVGQVFASPAAYPLVDSLYALLILVLWPLDAADDVALLVHGAKRLANSSDRGSFMAPHDGSSQNDQMSQRTKQNVDHIRLWYAICANETILTLGAGSISTSPAVDDLSNAFGSASELALSDGCTSDVLIVLQTSLHRIVIAAIGERGFSSDKNAPSIPKGREALLNYISTVHMFLTKLGEWEIEFYTISCECDAPEAAYYAVLEIEYHYLLLLFATHCVLTLCHACPLESAPQEIKTALWSWSITGNKNAHALIRLFNTYSETSPDSTRDTEHGGGTRLPPLALAPDRIFAMVVLAVMLVLRHQVASYEYGLRRGLAESPPAGFTKQAEMAIRKAIDHMGNIGHMKEDGGSHASSSSSSDHAASRYVDILEALFRIWEEKRALQRVASVSPASPAVPNGYTAGLEFGFATQQQKSGAGAFGGRMPQIPEHGHSGMQDGATMQLDLDLSLLGSDLFSDTAAAFTWDGVGTLDWGAAVQ